MEPFKRNYHTDFDLNDPELSARWDEIVADFHQRCPVARSEVGEGYWVVNRYKDVARCAKDWKTFSSADGFMVNRPEGMPYFPPAEIDPPLQRALRAVLEPFLRPKTVEALAPIVRTHANALIDVFIDKGEVEIVSQFANPLPQVVFSATIAGMDVAEMPALLEAFSFVGPEAERAANFQRGMARIDDYLRRRSTEPSRGDIVDALLAFEHARFTWQDKVGTLCQLTIGGIGTTGYAFSGGLYHLATHPEDRHKLVADPARIPTALDEFLRLFLGVVNMARRVTTEVEVNGVQMAAGDRILMSFGAACRDPTVFAEPNTLNIERAAVPHLAFGAGTHRCIGEWLARTVLQVGFETFLARIPDFEVAEHFVPKYETGSTRHMIELPLKFSRAR
jgi:cytochrome P450